MVLQWYTKPYKYSGCHITSLIKNRAMLLHTQAEPMLACIPSNAHTSTNMVFVTAGFNYRSIMGLRVEGLGNEDIECTIATDYECARSMYFNMFEPKTTRIRDTLVSTQERHELTHVPARSLSRQQEGKITV